MERLGEPLLYNIAAIFVFLFGKYTTKIRYDLIPRQPYAFGIDYACRRACTIGIQKLVIIEFGVAGGAGLMNMIDITDKLKKEYKREFLIVGFDSGIGMPPPIDFRDHPEKYQGGDYPMYNKEKLVARLPANAKIYFGDVEDTIKTFLDEFPPGYTIGFISFDLDYYSSTKTALEVLKAAPGYYLPAVPLYFDDIQELDHNEYCGELLAMKEFNQVDNRFRKISKMTLLRYQRIFKQSPWLDQMYFAHIFDSAYRRKDSWVHILDNPYLD